MPFSPAICTQCGATIEVDSSMEAAVCKHCGTPFIVEKAIQQYNTYHNTINNIANANLSLVDKDTELKRAISHLRLKNFDMAASAFQNLVEYYPDYWAGWYGLTISEQKGFQDGVSNGAVYGRNHRKCMGAAIELSSGELKTELQRIDGIISNGVSAKSNAIKYNSEIEDKYNAIKRDIKSTMHQQDVHPKHGDVIYTYPGKDENTITLSDIRKNSDPTIGTTIAVILTIIMCIVTWNLWHYERYFLMLVSGFFTCLCFGGISMIPEAARNTNEINAKLRNLIEERDALKPKVDSIDPKKKYINFDYMKPFELL